MKKYEYARIKMDTATAHSDHLAEFLTGHGQAGWRLVHLQMVEGAGAWALLEREGKAEYA